MDSLLIGLEKDSERNLIRYETGSAALFHPAYWDEREFLPLDLHVKGAGALVAELRERGIPAVSRIDFGGDLIVYRDPFPEDGSMQVRLTGIDVTRDSDVFGLKENVARGRWPERGEEAVLMGQWLARDLGAEVGYGLTVVTRTEGGYYQTKDLEGAGILESENPMVNRYGLYVPLDTVREALEMEDGATAVYVSLPGGRREAAALEELNSIAAGKGLDALDWRVQGADFVDLARAKSSGSKVVLILVFLIAAVGISNTVLMSIFERVRELGMMRALGMSDCAIRKLFLMESAGIGLIGSTSGVILGALANIPLVLKGIDYSEVMESGDMGYRISTIVYGAWVPGSYLTAFVIGLLMTVLVAWFPTRRALKLEIPLCLRFN
jgi:ABC-type lipoprotein release transport system permease subunit